MNKILLIRCLIVTVWVLSFSLSYYALKLLIDNVPKSLNFLEHLSYFGTNKWFYIGAVFYPLSVLLSWAALRIMPVSTHGPVFFVLGVLITISLGMFCFAETIGVLKCIGLLLCLIGIALILIK